MACNLPEWVHRPVAAEYKAAPEYKAATEHRFAREQGFEARDTAPCTGVNAPACGVGIDTGAGDVDPIGAKLPGTGLKAVSGVGVAGAKSKEDATGAQAGCAGA